MCVAAVPHVVLADNQGLSEPQSTSATYGDWTLQCRNVATEDAKAAKVGAINPGMKACEIVETLRLSSDGQSPGAIIAQIAIGRPQPASSLMLTAVLPSDLALPSEVKVLSDEKNADSLVLTWKKCAGGACYASADVSGQVVGNISNFKNPGVEWVAGNGQKVRLSMSIKGLNQAYQALLVTENKK